MFDLLIRRPRRRTTVPVTKPLVAANVLGLDQVLAAALAGTRPDIVLDLSAVRECDNAGATLLQAFFTLVAERGGRVEVVGAHPAVSHFVGSGQIRGEGAHD